MGIITDIQVNSMLDSIKEYQEEIRKANEFINSIIYEGSVDLKIGSNLMDSLIDLMEIAFNDEDGLFVWYIFENEFGKNKLTRKIDGDEVNIDSARKILDRLSKHTEYVNNLDELRLQNLQQEKERKSKRRVAKSKS
ncbi:MAG: hypothetical protein JWP12_1620 [Bacteroidetes bacterium]|nr:hypothetical protein [Bacteroidota bacterium]